MIASPVKGHSLSGLLGLRFNDREDSGIRHQNPMMCETKKVGGSVLMEEAWQKPYGNDIAE